jgi:putative ABC transport system permease protein
VRAVVAAARGGVAGRRVQAVVIGLVVLAATAACVLALGLLADTNSPFNHAFAAQRGADVTATVDTSVASPAEIAATGELRGVTAMAGPFSQTTVTAAVSITGVSGTLNIPLTLVGRSSPGGPVDDLTLDSGHWPQTDGQVVVSRTALPPGASTLTITSGSAQHTLTVVGVADSVTNTARAWVRPAEIAALGGTRAAQVLYRFASAGSTSAVASDVAELRAALPSGALSTQSYLTVQQSESSNIAPWVPFIVAFGVIALVMSVLIVVNVVSGAVVSGTTRIGVLKSIGFSPAQVVASYVLQVAVPALIGCVVGALCGNLLAAPLLSQNAQVYQVGTLGIPFWVDLAVPLGVLGLTAVAAVLPALRAGRMSAIAAIATGRAPRARRGYAAQRMLGRLRSLPRAVTLGLAAPFARPTRTLVTVVAVLFGALAVTFGAGLTTSLDRAQADLSLQATEPVQVQAGLPVKPGPAGAGVTGAGLTGAPQRAVVSALNAQPGTLRYVPETDVGLTVPGLSDPVHVTSFGGDASWTGYALIAGSWYSGNGTADVNTEFLTATGTSVGSSYPLTSGGRHVTVRIVGEVFAPGHDLDMYLSSATLAAVAPGLGVQQYDVGVRPGTNEQAYANALSAQLGPGYAVLTNAGSSKVFSAVLTLAAMLTIALAAVAGLGVLNTVALQIRERAHDIGVFKAVGMTPRQTLAMVVCSVTAVGLVAGIVAVPVGVFLHHGVVPVMAHAANSGLPASLLSVYSSWELILLALAGLVIAVAGALAPASWAARTRTAFALRAE